MGLYVIIQYNYDRGLGEGRCGGGGAIAPHSYYFSRNPLGVEVTFRVIKFAILGS